MLVYITISNVFYCCLTLSRIGSRPKQFNLSQLFGKHWQNMISESDNSIFIVVLMFYQLVWNKEPPQTFFFITKFQVCRWCFLQLKINMILQKNMIFPRWISRKNHGFYSHQKYKMLGTCYLNHKCRFVLYKYLSIS